MRLSPAPGGPAPGGRDTAGAAASLSLVFATFERPHVAQRLIRSVRRYFPDLPIYLADQSLQPGAQASFCRQMDVRLIRMDFDAGVAASRNALVAAIDTPYFVLCDDDFIIGPRTRFDGALRILQRQPEIGVVGGKLYDFHVDRYYPRHWELYLQFDAGQRLLSGIPIDRFAPQAREIGGMRFYMCDAVMNFAVMRRAMFSPQIRWDERFKSNGEHEDFFLNLKTRGGARVCYLPTMVAYHHHPEEYSAYRQHLRDRTEGWRLFMEKWGIDQHLEFGGALRSLADVSNPVNEAQVSGRFYLNGDLALRPPRPGQREALAISSFTTLVPLGALDEAGDPRRRGDRTARLLLDRAHGTLVAVRDRGSAAQTEFAGPAEPPRIGPASEDLRADSGQATPPIDFRYDCVARDDADFVLWHRVGGAREAGSVNVVLRWWHGTWALVWETLPLAIDLTHPDIWQPLLVETPLWPKDATFLRFAVLAWAGEAGLGKGGEVLCTGFLGRPAPPPRETFDAHALQARAPQCGPSGSDAGDGIALAGSGVPSIARLPPGDVIWPDSVEGLVLMRFAAKTSGCRLFFVDWPGTGAAMMRLDLPPETAEDPPWFAVPRPGASGGDAALYRQNGAEPPVRLALPVEASSSFLKKRTKKLLLSPATPNVD